MAATLTGYGGVGEIGGNAFLLEAPGLRVFLDLGKRFGATSTMKRDPVTGKRSFAEEDFTRRAGWNDYFDTFLQPRTHSAVRDQAALGLLPWAGDLARLYRGDLGGAPGPAPVDAVLVSHAHIDHCGLLGLVRPDVPVAASRQTLATLDSMETTTSRGWDYDFLQVPARASYERKDDGGIGEMRQKDDAIRRRPLVTDGRALGTGKWNVEFFDVDHSIQGASAFVMTDGDTKVVYSGDFRSHGLEPEKTARFLKAAVEPDVLIMEGTNVRAGGHGHHNETDREVEVGDQVKRLVEEHDARGGPAFVAVGYPPRDLDRLRSLHRVARQVGRRLLIAPKQAHVIDSLRNTGRDDLPDWRHDPNLGVFLRSPEHGILDKRGTVPVTDKATLAMERIGIPDGQWLDLAARELFDWEFRMLGGVWEKVGSKKRLVTPVPFGDPHVVTPDMVRADAGQYLLSLNLFTMNNLFDLFPDPAKAGGLYIHSQTQPHNDDMEQDLFRLQRWLRAFNLNAPDHLPKRTHVSGHVSEEDLHHILDELRPKLLVPIHSEYPGLTRDRYESRSGRRALLLEWGQAHTVA
ncbi:MAG: MBL fold metallo-hydrolase [Thermoplasmatota archaeon]